ncbi:MAG: tryptophan 7-halogenase [Wenzhouxiangellaceae bacterium]
MTQHEIRKVVIAGGGTAGWMAAAVLACTFGDKLSITVVESSAIGIVGVGEATIPQIRLLNRYLGLDENDFLRHCQGTFKLGIQFNGWTRDGESYLHAFGDIGLAQGLIPFHHYWLRAWRQQLSHDLWSYSLNTAAAMAHRFERLERIDGTPLTGINYAFHFDASLYADYLRFYSQRLGVEHIDSKIETAPVDSESGFIQCLQLADGRKVEGDLFIDCTGFRGLLIEQTLNSGYDDWSHWLPCDRAVASACRRADPLLPYTQASAREAGWQWRIPLQHRTGNGYVYCSQHLDDDQATDLLLQRLDGKPLGEPRQLRFVTGRRREFWRHNCIALGLASGFLEPLESTSIHLIQSGISRLINLFPDRHCDPRLQQEYNRHTATEYAAIRDFLILHYVANQRQEHPFWRDCAALALPNSLQHKIELFKTSGSIHREGDELFTEGSWLQVMWGQGIRPQRQHPAACAMAQTQLTELLSGIRRAIKRSVNRMPSHADFIARNCRTPTH